MDRTRRELAAVMACAAMPSTLMAHGGPDDRDTSVTGVGADELLVARFLERRDEGSFVALYDRHTPKLFGLALRLSGGAEAEACDLVQETWTRAVDGLEGFRGDARLSSWLCGICANVWRESLRRRRPEVPLEVVPERASSAVHADRTTPVEPLDVRRALDRLAPGYRAVLVLHGIYGFTHAEVAEILGISEGTSKSQLLRGRRALRALIGDQHAEEGR